MQGKYQSHDQIPLRGRPQCTRASYRLTEGLQFENVSHSPISLIIYLLIKCFCGIYYLPGVVLDPLQTFTILILKYAY